MLKARGLIATLKMIVAAWLDEREDRARGILSQGYVDPSRMNLINGRYANYYQPVRSAPFRRLLNELKPNLDMSFVDIGAGTGKAMILAAEHGFKSVRGVELVPELVQTAESNFKHWNTHTGKTPLHFELNCGDALAFPLRPSDRFIFMNDPFSDEVFAPFLKNLMTLYEQCDQSMWIVYKNNGRRRIPSLERLKGQARYFERDFSGNLFQIYIFEKV